MQKNMMQCKDCSKVLPLSMFRSCKNRSGSISHRHDCKDCELKKSRERYWQKAQSKIDTDKNSPLRFRDFYRQVKGR